MASRQPQQARHHARSEVAERQQVSKLVKWADVFIVNTPHPARKKLKLEYDDVVQWNPRLIYADLTGFGEKGRMPSCPASTSRHIGHAAVCCR